MKKKQHIAIVGAGIVGLISAALLGKSLHSNKFHIHVIDAEDEPNYKENKEISLRVSALSRGSIEILERLGVWRHIKNKHAYPYENMQVWDASDVSDGMSAIDFKAMEFGLSELGFIVENNSIKDELLTLVRSLGISIHYGSKITTIEQSQEKKGVEIKLSDDQSICADLLIGADGANSLTRELFNIQLEKHDYAQSAFVVHVATEKDHLNTAWQRFLPEGPIALLPLGDNKASIVWTTISKQIEMNAKLNDIELGKLLSNYTDYVLGDLKVISKRANFDLRYQHAKRYIDKNFALVGDAAHNIHPLAGQGVNLGIADAECLINTIDKILCKNEYIGDIISLRPYERERKRVNWLMLSFVDVLNRLFSIRHKLVENFRNIGMRLFNKSRYFKGRAIKTALGINF
jgi:2-octaprenylphenol hydroxylase